MHVKGNSTGFTLICSPFSSRSILTNVNSLSVRLTRYGSGSLRRLGFIMVDLPSPRHSTFTIQTCSETNNKTDQNIF